MKRTFGADLVSCLEWSAVNGSCEKTGAGKDAKISMIAFPKEVYKWYNSASLHTGKKAIPKQVYVLVVLAVLIPLMIYFAYAKLMRHGKETLPGASAPVSAQAVGLSRGEEKRAMTPQEYMASFQPRVAGLSHTAPRYDQVSQAVEAPKVAACIKGVRFGSKVIRCDCWTQQATPLPVTYDMCLQIVAGGIFDDTIKSRKEDVSSRPVAALPGSGEVVPFVASFDSGSQTQPMQVKSTISRDSEVLSFMAGRKYIK